jgi:hypothetical protein
MYQVAVPIQIGQQISAPSAVNVAAASYGGRRLYVVPASLPNVELPDQGTLTVNFANPLPAGVSADEIRLVLAVDHADVNDLTVILSRTGGLDPSVMFRQAGAGEDLDYTIFSTSARRALAEYVGPFHGSFLPDEVEGMKTLTKNLANSNLVLNITDDSADNIKGVLRYAAIEIYTPLTPASYSQWQAFQGLPTTATATTDNNHNGTADMLDFTAANAVLSQPGQLKHNLWPNLLGVIMTYEASENITDWQTIVPTNYRKQIRDLEHGRDQVQPTFRWANGQAPRFLRLRFAVIP